MSGRRFAKLRPNGRLYLVTWQKTHQTMTIAGWTVCDGSRKLALKLREIRKDAEAFDIEIAPLAVGEVGRRIEKTAPKRARSVA